MLRKYSTVLFVSIVLAVSCYYGYPRMLAERPQSIHAWRQADDASFALNYYQDGMHFFQPEVNNLTTNGGTSGKTAPGENTYMYYFIAVLYHIFGYHDFIFRLVFTLIFLTGLFFLYKSVFYLFKDVFWATALPILIFTSPVIMYYGNNYLPNAPALAFVFIGWYYFFRYRDEGKDRYLWIFMLFFLLAGWLKITALLSLVAIGGMFIMEWIFGLKIRKTEKIFRSPGKFILTASILVLLVGSWIVFSEWYNRVNDSTYFVQKAFPFWTFSMEELHKVVYNIRHIWLTDYFHPIVLVFFGGTIIFILLHIRKSSRFFILTNLFLLAGILVFVMMFFWFFRDHDYYTINLYILPVFLVLTTLDIIKTNYPRFFRSLIVKSLFAVFLLFNVWYAQKTVSERYTGKANESYLNMRDLYSVTPYLRQIGISHMDTVIFVPANNHVSLYLMNVKGWTQYIDTRFGKGAWVYYNRDRAGIRKSISHGAQYLVVNGLENLFLMPYLDEFAVHLKGRYGKVLIFDLKDTSTNFTLPERKLVTHLFCDAEHLSPDGKQFINPPDSTRFEYGEYRTDHMAHSGKYSIALEQDHPYGMTVEIDSVEQGDQFVISVWKNAGNEDDGTIVISGKTASEPLYNGEYKIVAKGSDGWQKIEKNLFIPGSLQDHQVKIYLYNPSQDTVFFDDLEIRRFSGE